MKNKKGIQKSIDDSEITEIKYYDNIQGKWIKVNTTKRIARFMNTSKQQQRRKQNQYNYFNVSFDSVFSEFLDESNMIEDAGFQYFVENDEQIEDLNSIKNYRIIKNSFKYLTPEQKEVIRLKFYKNKSLREIGEMLSISKQSVFERIKNAEKNIKRFLKIVAN